MARLIALLLVLLVAACAPAAAPSAPPSTTPSASQTPSSSAAPEASLTPATSVEPSTEPSGPQVPFDEVFLAVTARGGHCMVGACETVTVVGRDGRISRLVPDPAELGTVRPDVLESLDLAIQSADFEQIKAQPFTGECPTAFDGQELVYEFAAPSGVQKIASCEVGIDESDPLWLTVAAALAFGEG